MCIAVPAKIISINGDEALVDFGGLTRYISIFLTPEAKPNDYVIIHAGFAISILNEEEAKETLDLLENA